LHRLLFPFFFFGVHQHSCSFFVIVANVIVWECIKNRNSALVHNRNSCVSFSRERGNLRNLNTLTGSGLAQDRTIDIKRTQKGLTASIKSPRPSSVRQPAKAI
jgi:hypothetical protein